jgi:hypothetical protein
MQYTDIALECIKLSLTRPNQTSEEILSLSRAMFDFVSSCGEAITVPRGTKSKADKP